MEYRPSLDGLRALAVTGVVLCHTGTLLPGGGRGVDVFFVLSGYLITTILRTKPDGFLLRRARRLVPGLVVFLAAYLLTAPLLFPADNGPRETILALLYVSNWSMAFDFRESGLAHVWSLAVEAQFYLLWPLILPRVWPMWLGAAWLILTASRYFIPDPIFTYYALPFHATGLILGALVALKRPPPQFGWLGLIAIALAYRYGSGWGAGWQLPATELGTALLISALLQPSLLTSIFAWKPAAWIGLISYGIYLWHWPVALLTQGRWWSFGVTYAASIGLAAASYYGIEQRFRKKRHVPISPWPAVP